MTPHEASRCAVREGRHRGRHLPWPLGRRHRSERARPLGFRDGPLRPMVAWAGVGGRLPGAWALGTVAGAGAGSGRLCTERERRSACRAPGPLPENDVKDFRPVVTLPVTGSVGGHERGTHRLRDRHAEGRDVIPETGWGPHRGRELGSHNAAAWGSGGRGGPRMFSFLPCPPPRAPGPTGQGVSEPQGRRGCTRPPRGLCTDVGHLASALDLACHLVLSARSRV